MSNDCGTSCQSETSNLDGLKCLGAGEPCEQTVPESAGMLTVICHVCSASRSNKPAKAPEQCKRRVSYSSFSIPSDLISGHPYIWTCAVLIRRLLISTRVQEIADLPVNDSYPQSGSVSCVTGTCHKYSNDSGLKSACADVAFRGAYSATRLKFFNNAGRLSILSMLSKLPKLSSQLKLPTAAISRFDREIVQSQRRPRPGRIQGRIV